MWVQSLGLEDPLEKEMAPHSRILAWKIPWTEEPGGPQSMASQTVGHNLVTKQPELVLSALRVSPVCWFGLSSFTLGCSTPDRKFCFSTWSQMSVLNMVVSRHPGNTEPVKAKEELIFHCGFRRFRASPLFSQHTAGKQGSFWVFVHLTVC